MRHALSPTRSLSTRLVLFSLVTAVVPMLVLTFVINNVASDNIREVTRRRIDAQSSGSVEQIELYLEERRSDGQLLASLPLVIAMYEQQLSDEAVGRARPIATAARDAYGYQAVVALDALGQVAMSSDDSLLGRSYADRPEVQAAQGGVQQFGEVRVEPGWSTPTFTVATPVRSGAGDVLGVVYTIAPMTRIDAVVASDSGKTGDGSYSVLVDEHMVRISIPDYPSFMFRPAVPLPAATAQTFRDRERFGPRTADIIASATNFAELNRVLDQIRRTGSDYEFFRDTANSGEQSESTLRRLRTIPWYYAHRVPIRSYEAAIVTQTSYALLLTLIASIISVSVTVLLVRGTISRPLAELVSATRSLAGGDLQRRLALRRQDEIGVLASSFNAMATTIEERIVAEQAAQADAERLRREEAAGRQRQEEVVAEYLAFVERVSQGDLTRRLPAVDGDGALERLGRGLNGMVESLHLLTGQVSRAATAIAAAAGQILAATTQQASSAAEQSSAIGQTSQTVVEVRAIAVEAAEQATRVATDSQAALQLARQGADTVERTVQGMSEIRAQVESSARTIIELADQTQAIGAITTVVSELADQSNLLALNAALEAARAGEQGRSFAVVAQNVRQLAERSKDATRQVREILVEIQRAADQAVRVAEEGGRGADNGATLAAAAGEVIHRIAGEVESGAAANTQMADGARQATLGLDQIGIAIDSVRDAATQALASTRQAERAAKDLHELAGSLQQAVAAYRL